MSRHVIDRVVSTNRYVKLVKLFLIEVKNEKKIENKASLMQGVDINNLKKSMKSSQLSL